LPQIEVNYDTSERRARHPEPTNVSEEHIAFIFTVEESAEEQTSVKAGAAWHMPSGWFLSRLILRP
jgi:hypothetical protein